MMMSTTTMRLGGCLWIAALLAGCAASPPQPAPPSERAKAQMRSADDFLARGLLDSALAAFGLALEENPEIVEAHLGMGHIYRQLDNYTLAGNHYERAANLDPTNYDAHYGLGLMRH